MSKLLTGRLEAWSKDQFGRECIWGHIYDDSRGRFTDGELIHTSYIPDFNNIAFAEGMVIDTLNSHYYLGKRALNVGEYHE